MIKNIFFDVMGVVFIVGDDTNDLLVPFVQKFNKEITREQINEFYQKASLGIISSKEFWKNMGIDESNIDYIEKTYLDENLIIDSDIITVIKELKEQGYKIGFLSNDVSEWGRYLRKKFHLDDLLDYCFISGDVGVRKPNFAIYENLVKECNIKPEESVFIDDRLNNLIPAERLGFKTILFDRDNRYEGSNKVVVYNSLEIIEKIKSIF